MTTTLARMRQLIGTPAEWAANDLVIGNGEIAIIREGVDVPSMRVGDGVRRLSELPNVGVDFVSVIEGDGVTDTAAEIVAANAAGNTIIFQGLQVIGTPTTITVPIADTFNQIFAPGAQVTIDNGLPVRPEWFGFTVGCIMRAVNALPAVGGVVILADRRYPPSYNTITTPMILNDTATAGVDYLAKANVTILGTKLPKFRADGNALEGGTIVDGFFAVFAPGFQIDLVGFDSGVDVVNARYAGAPQDGFDFAKPNHVAGGAVSRVYIGRVIGLCADKTAAGHGVLIEGIDGGRVDFAEGRNAMHGCVIKSRNMLIGTLVGRGTSLESVIFKSDNYGVMDNVYAEHIECSSRDTATQDDGFGFLIAGVTAAAGQVQVGSVNVTRKANGVGLKVDGAGCADITIGQITTDLCPIGILYSGAVIRTQIADAFVRRSTFALRADAGCTAKSNRIARLQVANATDGINCDGSINVGSATFDNITQFCLSYPTVAARIFLENYNVISAPALWPLQPALANGWTQFAGGSPFRQVLAPGGRGRLTGKLVPGSAAGVCGNVSTQIRPAVDVEVACVGYNGAAPVTVYAKVTTGGVVTVSNFAAAPTFVLLDLEWDIPY